MSAGIENGFLLLGEHCLSPARASRLDMATLEVAMLWPDDEPARERALHASTVAFMRTAEGQPLPCYPGFDAFGFAAEALPLAVLHEPARASSMAGFLAGFVLHQAVARRSLAMGAARLEDVVSEALKVFGTRPMQALGREGRLPEGQEHWRCSASRFNNEIWPTFRRVAHLWAAFVSEWPRVGRSFPCEPPQLGAFLRTAEAYRLLGEDSRLLKARNPVLRPNETLRFSFAIEPAEIAFQTALEHDGETLSSAAGSGWQQDAPPKSFGENSSL